MHSYPCVAKRRDTKTPYVDWATVVLITYKLLLLDKFDVV